MKLKIFFYVCFGFIVPRQLYTNNTKFCYQQNVNKSENYIVWRCLSLLMKKKKINTCGRPINRLQMSLSTQNKCNLVGILIPSTLN